MKLEILKAVECFNSNNKDFKVKIYDDYTMRDFEYVTFCICCKTSSLVYCIFEVVTSGDYYTIKIKWCIDCTYATKRFIDDMIYDFYNILRGKK